MREKEKTKLGKGKIIALVVIGVLMAAAIAVTFTFWAAGIDSGDTSTGMNIQIGSAERVRTTINLSSTERVSPAGRLIPTNIPLATGEVHSVSYLFNVEWVVSGDFADSGALAGVEGELDVSVDEILVGGVDFKDAMGWDRRGDTADEYVGEVPLFVYEIEAPATIVGNASPEEVLFTLKMNIPYDADAYDALAGQQIEVVISFLAIP